MSTRALVSLLIPAALTVPAPAPAMAQDAPVRIWLNQDGRFVQGDKARVEVRAERDGYLLVLHADPDGRIRVLFPLDPREDNFVREGKKYEVRSRGDRDAFHIQHSNGTGMVYAALSLDPFQFGDFVRGDHWDYRRLRLPDEARDTEAEVTSLVERMAPGGGFDYDVLWYDVVEPIAYSYPSTLYTGGLYGCYYCGDRYHGYGTRIHIGIGLGSRYYDPFYYDPFYYYDPWYYYPRFYYPTYYYPRYYPRYWYPYDGFYYPYGGHRYYGRAYWPSSPYRFKGDTFRDRDRRAYNPRDRRRATTNLTDYRGRGDNPLGVRRPTIERSRQAVRGATRVERPSTARRPAPRDGRSTSIDAGRTTERRRAAPARAEPQRSRPSRAEPEKASPRRAGRSSPSRRSVAPSSSSGPRRVGRTSSSSTRAVGPSSSSGPRRVGRTSSSRRALGPSSSSGPRRVGRTSSSRRSVASPSSGSPGRASRAPSRSSSVRTPSRGGGSRSVSRGSSGRRSAGASVSRAPSSRGSGGARGGRSGGGGRRGR